MVFILHPDRPLPVQLRSLATEQIDKARERLTRPAAELDHGIHDARRALRRARAIVAFARPADDARRIALEQPLRLAGRELSPLRDAQSALETLAWLQTDARGVVGAAVRRRLHIALARDYRRVMGDAAARIAAADAALLAALSVSEFVADDERVDALAGLARTYARARRCLADACADPSEDAIHRFRRRARTYYWQLELLREVRPGVVPAESAEIRRIAQGLGRARDLHLLAQRMARWRDAGSLSIRRTITRLHARAEALRREALGIARVAFAEKPSVHERRWRAQAAARYAPVAEVEATLARDAPPIKALRDRTHGRR